MAHEIADAMEMMKKKNEKSKPRLRIHASMDSYDSPMNDMKYRKEEMDRLKGETKAIEDEISNWDGNHVAAQALSALKRELASKKARLMECEALMEDEEGEE